MKPQELGKKYDKIAQWWHEQHQDSLYGMKQIDMALKFASEGRLALDVGCGSGGRIIRKLEEQGFAVTGLDVSEAMVNLAHQHHPDASFLVQDICTWETYKKFDFIIARMRTNPSTFLDRKKPNLSEFARKNLPRVPIFFRNVENYYSPFPVPFFHPPEFQFIKFIFQNLSLAVFR